jgi:hypothetical protein
MLSSNPVYYAASKRLPRGFLAKVLYALLVCVVILLGFVIDYLVSLSQNEQLVLYSFVE